MNQRLADLEKRTAKKEEKAALRKAAQIQYQCQCGNKRIKEHHNYCGLCGRQLKENPVIIDYFSLS